MRTYSSLLWTVLLPIALSGCGGGVSSVEQMVVNGSVRNFQFEGTWRPADEKRRDDGSVIISRPKGSGDYSVTFLDDAGATSYMKVRFQAAEIDRDDPKAIVETERNLIDLTASPGSLDSEKWGDRRILVAKATDDKLFVWSIDGRKLGECLYKSQVSAVIEHSRELATVRCEPELLLKTLKQHLPEVIGEVQVFTRVVTK
jgi:hypothetical protein